MSDNVHNIDERRRKKLEDAAEGEPAAPPLQHGGGGGTSGLMDKAYIDSRIEAVEARTDLKLGKLATKATVWQAVGSIVGAFVIALTIALAVMAFGGDRFDSGMGLAEQRQAQIVRDAGQDHAVVGINDKLDVLIKGQQAAPKK